MKATGDISRDKMEDFIQTYKKMRKKYNPSDSNILCMNEHLEIIQNRIYGRHIVAKNDINTGE